MIKDQNKWSDFEKKEVSHIGILDKGDVDDPKPNSKSSSNPRSSKTATSTSRLNAVGSVAPMFTQSMAVGVIARSQSALGTKSLARPSKSATK